MIWEIKATGSGVQFSLLPKTKRQPGVYFFGHLLIHCLFLFLDFSLKLVFASAMILSCN